MALIVGCKGQGVKELQVPDCSAASLPPQHCGGTGEQVGLSSLSAGEEQQKTKLRG